jgi:hypothetical protein
MMKDRQRARGRSRLAAARKKPVGSCHRRTVDLSSEHGEFVPKHHDFQLLEIGRPQAQGN